MALDSAENLKVRNSTKAEEIRTQAKADEAFKMGLKYFNDSTYGKAIDEFNKVIKLFPEFPNIAFNLGIAYLRDGQIDSALNQFHREMAAGIKKPYIYSGIVIAYSEKALTSHTWCDSITNLAQSLKSNLFQGNLQITTAESDTLLFNIASAYIKCEKYQEAIDILTMLIAKEGDLSREARQHRADAYHHLGKTDSCSHDLKKMEKN